MRNEKHFPEFGQPLNVRAGFRSFVASFHQRTKFFGRVFFKIQGHYTKADSLLARAIGIGEKSLGADHPDVATWLNNRAALLEKQVRGEKLFHVFLEVSSLCCLLDAAGLRGPTQAGVRLNCHLDVLRKFLEHLLSGIRWLSLA